MREVRNCDDAQAVVGDEVGKEKFEQRNALHGLDTDRVQHHVRRPRPTGHLGEVALDVGLVGRVDLRPWSPREAARPPRTPSVAPRTPSGGQAETAPADTTLLAAAAPGRLRAARPQVTQRQ
ncbi:hypothetical protein [Streptomyces sp. NPDC057582]